MLLTRPSESSPREIARELDEVRAEQERIARRLQDATTDGELVDAQRRLELSRVYLLRLEEALVQSSKGWERRS